MDFEQIHIVVLDLVFLLQLYNLIFSCPFAMLYCAFAEVTAPSACCIFASTSGRSRIASVSFFCEIAFFYKYFRNFSWILLAMAICSFLFCLEFALFYWIPQPINRDAIATKVIVFSWVLTFNLICVLLIHPLLLWFQEPTNVVLSEYFIYRCFVWVIFGF
jgi:hypothetical protein